MAPTRIASPSRASEARPNRTQPCALEQRMRSGPGQNRSREVGQEQGLAGIAHDVQHLEDERGQPAALSQGEPDARGRRATRSNGSAARASTRRPAKARARASGPT